MLDGLKNSLGDAIKKIVKSSGIDDDLIKELSKDVQRALLQSDVNVRLVLEITKSLEERALNEIPPPGLSRKDHIVKILYDELSKLLGNEKSKIVNRNDEQSYQQHRLESKSQHHEIQSDDQCDATHK